MKTKDQWSEPVGVIVLLHCTIRVDHSLLDGTYGFFLGNWTISFPECESGIPLNSNEVTFIEFQYL